MNTTLHGHPMPQKMRQVLVVLRGGVGFSHIAVRRVVLSLIQSNCRGFAGVNRHQEVDDKLTNWTRQAQIPAQPHQTASRVLL